MNAGPGGRPLRFTDPGANVHRLLQGMRPDIVRLLGEGIDLRFDVCEGEPLAAIEPRSFERLLSAMLARARDAIAGRGLVIVETHDVEGGGRSGACRHSSVVVSVGAAAGDHLVEGSPEPDLVDGPDFAPGFDLAGLCALARPLGGTIDLVSIPGVAIRISASLPRMDRADAGSARILVVDDEAEVRRCLGAMLTAAGYDVAEAAEGGEALRTVRDCGADLVITDLVMPGCEGFETIRLLKRSWPALGIIAVSGARNPDYLQIACALGAAAALPKPVDRDTLCAAVADVLQGRPYTGGSLYGVGR